MERVPALRLAAYGILGFPLAMAALPIYVHVPHFYADTLGLSLASVGGLLLAARFLDAVQDPLLGWWSDRRRDRRGGRWVFVIAGAPLLALGMVGLFNPPDWPGSRLGIWLIANLIIVYLAYSLVTISYQAYGAEISGRPRGAHARDRVARRRRAAGRVPRRGASRDPEEGDGRARGLLAVRPGVRADLPGRHGDRRAALAAGAREAGAGGPAHLPRAARAVPQPAFPPPGARCSC